MNISKKRKYPYNEYTLYKLNKMERGSFLNVWFPGADWFDKRKKAHPSNSYWTLKKVDKDSASHLYGREYNNVSIRILPSYRNIGAFDMKAQIHSVDDSSYGIWFMRSTVAELEAIRLKIMRYVDAQKLLNGEAFLDFCESLGGIDKDYS